MKTRLAHYPIPVFLDAAATICDTSGVYEIDVLIVSRAASIPNGGMLETRAR